MPPESSPNQELPPVPETPTPLKQIRTFEGDVAEAIKRQNESLISIQRAEEKKREAIQTLTPNAPRAEVEHFKWKPLAMSLLTIVFVLGGGYGAYYAWTIYSEKTAPPPVEIPINQFIGAATVKEVDASVLGRQEIIDLMREVRLRDRHSTSVEQIEMRRASGDISELLSTEDFLSRLNSHAPNPLVRSFNDLFMLGVLGSDPSHTIIIIKLDSFENAFPGMLEWEGRIIEDILPLFLSQESLESVPTFSEFEDKTIQNHDTRVLKNIFGQTVLIYSFFDNSMLIITDEENSFRTIINRLQSEKLSR